MAQVWKTIIAGAAACATLTGLAGLAGCEKKAAPAAPAPSAMPPATSATATATAPAPALDGPVEPLPPPMVLPPLPRPAVPAPGFAARSARLATIPEGHELGEALFSADGRHVAFVTTQGGNAYPHLDGLQYTPFEGVRGMAFRPGTATFAYVGRRGSKEVVVLDGREVGRYAAVGQLRFAPDGRLVHSVKRGEAWGLTVGGQEREVRLDEDPEPIPSPDGRRVLYRDRSPATGKVVLRSCTLELDACVEGLGYDATSALVLDASGVRAAFMAARDGRQTVVAVDLDDPKLTERSLGWYDQVTVAALSDGGQHVAFLAARGEQALLVRDGQAATAPHTETPMQTEVSRTGRVIVLAARGGKVVALVDGKPAGAGVDELTFPAFSPDGLRLAYVAGAPGMNLLVVEGAQGPVYEKVVTPRFMPVGTGLVYRARRKDERFVVQANAKAQVIREHPHYQAVFDPVFAPDGKQVGYGVQAGRELWWKVEKLEGATPG